MADRGIRSKRRWAQYLGYAGSFIGLCAAVAVAIAPQAVVAFPQYSVPIGLGSVALTAAAAELAKRSKDREKTTDMLDRIK